MAAKPPWRNEEAMLKILCLIVALSGRSPSPKLLVDKDRDGGCETERRNEIGKLEPVYAARTTTSAPKKPRTLVLLASPHTPRTM